MLWRTKIKNKIMGGHGVPKRLAREDWKKMKVGKLSQGAGKNK